MFQKEELKRIRPLLIFWAAYSVLFFLWVKTFFYTLPFLLGLIFAVAVQPVIRFFEKKLHWNHTVSTAVVTVGALAILAAGLILLGVFAVREITNFIMRASEDGFRQFSKPVADFLNQAGSWLQKLDMDFLERNRQEIMDLLKSSMELVTNVLGAALGILTSLPTVVTMLLVTVFAAYFISRDMGKLRGWVKTLFSRGAVSHVKTAAENSGGMGQKYLLSYLFLYFITFCETLVILSVLELPYPLLTAVLAAAADILPVLGPGFVFLPLAVYQVLAGRYAAALGLAIGWGLISLIRQILEPKLVSSSVKVHPLATLAAIYFSLVGKSLWLLFYVMGLSMLYGAFRETGALPSLVKRSQ